MVVSPTFLDTNVLVYASVVQSPLHAIALDAILLREQTGVELWISRQVLREFLAVLTRPQLFAQPIPVNTLTAQVRAFEKRFRIAEDAPQVTSNLLAIIEQIPSGGAQIHDANIVATMQVYDLNYLLTHNTADFDRFAKLITVLPLVN